MTQDWKIKFRKVGDGSVRFIATRQEVEDFIESLLKEERNAVLSEVEKEVKNVIEQEAMWYNTNNQIPNTETVKGDEHWEMIQKVVKDSLKEASERMIKDISTIINNLIVK